MLEIVLIVAVPYFGVRLWMYMYKRNKDMQYRRKLTTEGPKYPKATTTDEKKQCNAINEYLRQYNYLLKRWKFERNFFTYVKYGYLPDIYVTYLSSNAKEPEKTFAIQNLLYMNGDIIRKEDEDSLFWEPLKKYMSEVVHEDFDNTVWLMDVKISGNSMEAELFFAKEKITVVIPYSYRFVEQCFDDSEEIKEQKELDINTKHHLFNIELDRLEYPEIFHKHLIKAGPKQRLGEYLTRHLGYEYHWGNKQDILKANPEADYAFVPFDNDLLRQYTDEFIKHYYRVTDYLTEGCHYITDEGIYFLRYRGTEYYKQTKNEAPLKANFEDIKDVGEFAEYSIPMYIFKDYKGYTKKMWNVYIPAGNGYYQEIDMIAITEYGILAFECKYRSLPVHIPENILDKWEDKKGSKFQSPVEQNKGHIKFLRRFLDDNGYKDMPIYNLICFFAKREECQKWNEEKKDIDTFFNYDSLYKEETDRLRVYAYENKNKDTLIGTHAEVKEKLDEKLDLLERKYTVSEIDSIFETLSPQILFSEEKKMQIVAMNKKLHENEK